MSKYYTVGEIARQGLLKNHKGEPYKHKATVLKIVQKLPHRKIQTPWGPGYSVAKEEIDLFNKHYEKNTD